MKNKPIRHPRERLMLLVAFALMLFATPVIYFWSHEGSPWYLIYLLWFAVIALNAWHSLSRRPDDL
jgi:hypothetical protein